MSGRDRFPALPVLCSVLVLLLLANNVLAYAGPGAGLDLVNYAASLGSLMMVMFGGILLWPFYSLLRFIRRRVAKAQPELPSVAAVVQPIEGSSNS